MSWLEKNILIISIFFLICLEARTSKLYNLTNSSNNTCLLKLKRTTSIRKFRRYWKVRKTKENQIIKKEIYTDLKGHSLDHLRDDMHGGNLWKRTEILARLNQKLNKPITTSFSPFLLWYAFIFSEWTGPTSQSLSFKVNVR